MSAGLSSQSSRKRSVPDGLHINPSSSVTNARSPILSDITNTSESGRQLDRTLLRESCNSTGYSRQLIQRRGRGGARPRNCDRPVMVTPRIRRPVGRPSELSRVIAEYHNGGPRPSITNLNHNYGPVTSSAGSQVASGIL